MGHREARVIGGAGYVYFTNNGVRTTAKGAPSTGVGSTTLSVTVASLLTRTTTALAAHRGYSYSTYRDANDGETTRSQTK